MSARNVVSVEIAFVLGYCLGLMEAMERLSYSQTLGLGAVGLVISVAVGLIASIGIRARLLNHLGVAILRGGLSGGVFVLTFEGVRLLAKQGNIALAVASWILAGAMGWVLAHLAPARSRSA